MSKDKTREMLHDPLAWLEADEDENDDTNVSVDETPKTVEAAEPESVDIDNYEEEDSNENQVEQDLSGLLDDGWGLFDDEPEETMVASANEVELTDDDWGMFDDDEPEVEARVVNENVAEASDETEKREGWGLFADGDESKIIPSHPKGPGWGLFNDNLPENLEGEVIILPESLTIKDVEECWHNIEDFIKGSSDKIHLDASLVEYIDGAGVQLIYAVKHYSEDFGKAYDVLRPSKIVRDAIDVAG